MNGRARPGPGGFPGEGGEAAREDEASATHVDCR